MSLNEDFNKNYQINAMLESVEESIMDFFEQSPWGYKMFFYLCALNKCHPSYLSYYEKKENLSISKLNDILSEIEPVPKKLLYDKKVQMNYIHLICQQTVVMKLINKN